MNEISAFFELDGRADDKVETYSKGMKQRLALARALLHQPPLLFLDEPTSGLDPEAAQQVNALIESLSHKGQTIILCTHNLTEAERLCDRVAVMNSGRALALGSLTELSRKLWPATWVDVKFWEAPSASHLEVAKSFSGAKQVEAAVCIVIRAARKQGSHPGLRPPPGGVRPVHPERQPPRALARGYLLRHPEWPQGR